MSLTLENCTLIRLKSPEIAIRFGDDPDCLTRVVIADTKLVVKFVQALTVFNNLNRDYEEELVQFDTNSTSYVDAFTHEYLAKEDGDYMVEIVILWNSTKPNNKVNFRVLLDTVPAAEEVILESNTSDSTVRAAASFFKRIPLTAGNHDFVLQVHAQTGSQTVSIFRIAMKFQRWEP